jgi:hypothetical protein
VGFEPTIPASEREKAVHASDLWANVTGKVTVGFRKLINEEVRSLHSLLSIISMGTSRNTKLMGHAARIVVGKYENKGTFGRPSHRWRNDIEILKYTLKKSCFEDVN